MFCCRAGNVLLGVFLIDNLLWAGPLCLFHILFVLQEE